MEKINKIHYKFFNPNGDIDDSNAVDWMYDRLDKYSCKRGEVTFNQPQNFNEVKEDIQKTKGLAIVVADVKFRDGAKGKITNDNFSEKYNLDIPENSSITEMAKIAMDALKNNVSVSTVGELNKAILKKFEYKIKRFL